MFFWESQRSMVTRGPITPLFQPRRMLHIVMNITNTAISWLWHPRSSSSQKNNSTAGLEHSWFFSALLLFAVQARSKTKDEALNISRVIEGNGSGRFSEAIFNIYELPTGSNLVGSMSGRLVEYWQPACQELPLPAHTTSQGAVYGCPQDCQEVHM